MDAGAPIEPPLFVEEQPARQWWLWLLVANFVFWVWYGFYVQIIQGRVVGSKPAPDWAWWLMAAILGVALPWLLYAVRLRFDLYPDRIVAGFVTPHFPLIRTTIKLERVESAEPVTYRPLRDYGGWGLRRSGKGIAYNMSGNRGALLTMKEGPNVLLGSRQPEHLAAAIQQALAEANRR